MLNQIQSDAKIGPVSQIVVIDDCNDMQLLIGKTLSKIGVRLSYASGGEEGLRMVADSMPDLILIDYLMPDCNGLEVLRRLQADCRLREIPAIMITGDNDPSLITSAFELGICDYINKPFLAVELRARVNSALKTQALMEDLKHRAGFDSLTGLPNKANLMDRIQLSIAMSRKGLASFAVMFIDLDRFKLINDSLGHDCGDLVLKEAAKRLEASVRCCDLVVRCGSDAIVSRFGGDEFVILIELIPTANAAELIAARISTAMCKPLLVGGQMHYLSASIGIVMSSGQYDSTDDVIRDADIAMYEAKAAGRGCFRLFEASMRSRAVQRWQLDADLRQAIERDQFFLQYQPIVDLKTGLVEGVEALIRWNHPNRGIIAPTEFIPTAEETGLIVAIGEWVTRTACKQYADWFAADSNATPNYISINLSRQQLIQSDFPKFFQSVLSEYGIAPSSVHFELTESEVMKGLAASVAAIKALRALGTKIDLDDFGTGYSSLACLHELPIDVLKLDRTLISKMDQGGYPSKLVELVLQLLSGSAMRVVAEGIETIGELSKLQNLQCHLGQGYYFSKPLDGDKLEAFVRKQRSQHSTSNQRNISVAPTIPTLLTIPTVQTSYR